MRYFTIIIMMLIASPGFAQNNPIDFEPDGYGADWTWTVFENETDPPLEIIGNPDQSGINTSATVAKFTALQDGNPWAGVESEHGVDLGTFEWDEDNRIVKIQVWKSVISDVGIKFATETGWAQEELKVSNTVTNEWEELTFDFSDFINPPDDGEDDLGTLGQIIIFPDFDDRDQDNVVYFDNITFHPADDDTPSDEPDVAAPTPPALDPDDVMSVFSGAFSDVEGTDFNPDWGQSTQVSIIEIEGSETLKYENFNYQGTQFAEALDVSAMDYLHLDMWTADATSVNVFCISPGPVETAFSLDITPNQWVSYDIPLSEFTDVDMTNLIQFKFDGGDDTQTIYLDNLYFHMEVVDDPDTYTVTFDIIDTDGNAITDAIVTFDGETFAQGHYVIEGVEEGTYGYIVEKDGYFPADDEVSVNDDTHVEITLSVDETSAISPEDAVISIYPNPVSATLYVEADATINGIRMIDVLGQVVYTSTVNDTRHELSVGGMKAGVYFVQLTTEHGIITQKVQVTR